MDELSSRQRQIIEAAVKIIGEKGIQEFTTKNLAKEVGVSEAALYRHFSGKIEILEVLLDSMNREVRLLRERVLNLAEQGNLLAIRKIFSARCDFLTANPYYTRVIFAEEIFQNEASLKQKIYQIMIQHQQVVETLLFRAKEQNEIHETLDLPEISLMVMGSFRHLVTQWRLSGFSFSLKDRFLNFFETFQNLVRKK